VGWVLAERHAGPPGDRRRGHLPRAAVRAAGGGTGAVASIGRRLLALLLDWLLCTLIALAVFHSRWWTLPIFAVETYLLTALTGFTVGKRILSIRVVRLDGRPVGLGWALVRTILLLLVVPALITDRDLRGLHDRAANTIVIRI
jgi:uncharacterized RDD family membrane protein YckC